jgi:pyruvate formate lyase activating enzyme
LCPHHCVIGDGKTGRCRVRENTKGEINLLTYGIVSSMGFDPIEKKSRYIIFIQERIFFQSAALVAR